MTTPDPSDPQSRPARRRPTYGLPGPRQGDSGQGADGAAPPSGATGQPEPYPSQPGGWNGQPGRDGSQAPRPGGQAQGTHQWGGQPGSYPSQPNGAYGPSNQPGPGSAGPTQPGGPQTDPRLSPWQSRDGGQPPAPSGRPSAGSTRRRRSRMLPIGAIILLVGVIIGIGGLLLGARGIMSAMDDGATAFTNGSSTTVEAKAFDLYIVYVPLDGAEKASCTAEGEHPGVVQSVAQGGKAPVGPHGDTYEQKIGVVSSQDTTITLTCSDASGTPMYLGPMSSLGIMLPMVLGAALGGLLGLVGLILVIIGFVRRRR